MKHLMKVGAVAAAMTAANMAGASTNLITNGDFETGDVSGWACFNTGGARDFKCDADTGGLTPNTGNFYMELFQNGDVGTVEQTFATTAGEEYNLSFFSSFLLSRDVNSLAYTINGGAMMSVAQTGSMAKTFERFQAVSDVTTLSFFYATESGSGIIGVDDVSVAAVPLPASALLLLGALGALGVRARRKAA